MSTNILIIDDEVGILEVLEEIFLELGVDKSHIFKASDALEGLVLAAKHDFTLICTDYNMPKLNGVELVKAIKNHCKNNLDATVVYITPMLPTPQETENFHNTFFINKPVEESQLKLYLEIAKNLKAKKSAA